MIGTPTGPVQAFLVRSGGGGHPADPLLLAIAIFAVVAIVAAASITGSPFVAADIPWRIVSAGIAIVILPGMVAGQSLGLLAASPFEAIAKSLALSLVIATGFALITMALRLPIGIWTGAMLLWNVGCALPLAFRVKYCCRRYGLLRTTVRGLLAPRPWVDSLLYLVIAGLSIVLYRRADLLSDVSSEVSTHMIYVRSYDSGLPLDFQNGGLRPEIGLPNLFFLWEFILAGISCAAGIDPLVAALRSRWLFPVLAFSAIFFLSRVLFGSNAAARRVIWIVLPLVLTQFIILPPSPWALLANDDRPVFSFLGSIHHADAAMEILLPISTGYLFLFLRDGRFMTLGMLAALLIASFFFHPREYFQVMWYGVIAGLVYLITNRIRLRELRTRYVPLALMFLAVAAVLLLATRSLSSDRHTISSELAGNTVTIENQLQTGNLVRAEPLFDFSISDIGAQPPEPPFVYSWLVLLALLLPCIVVAGSRAELKVAAYFVVLWWVTLCFVPTQMLLRLITYSEISMTKIRFLPVIAYPLIAAGWFAALRIMLWLANRYLIFHQKLSAVCALRMGAVALMCGALGLLFREMWRHEAPSFVLLENTLPWLVLLCAVVIWLVLRVPGVALRSGLLGLRADFLTNPRPDVVYTSFCFILFAVCSAPDEAPRFVRDLLIRNQSALALLEQEHPSVGLGTIDFFRKHVQPRSRILDDPSKPNFDKISIFAPVYTVPLFIILDEPLRAAAKEDRDPLFNSAARAGRINSESVISDLNALNIDYVLLGAEYRAAVQLLARERPAAFSVVFEDPVTGSLVLAYRRPT